MPLPLAATNLPQRFSWLPPVPQCTAVCDTCSGTVTPSRPLLLFQTQTFFSSHRWSHDIPYPLPRRKMTSNLGHCTPAAPINNDDHRMKLIWCHNSTHWMKNSRCETWTNVALHSATLKMALPPHELRARSHNIMSPIPPCSSHKCWP